MRWGSGKWGDGTQWGASAAEEALAWSLEVDWDRDGIFDGFNEAGNLLSNETFRGRRAWLDAGEEGGFSSIATGSAQITLRNTDGRYDPWNTGSPLYPNVSDGCEVRLRNKDLNTGLVKDIFFGVVTNISGSNFQDEPTAVLQVEDGWRNLRRTPGRVAMAENVTPDTAVGLVLDAAKWPARWGRDLDLASDNIAYFWSSGGRKAGAELERLAQSFLGYFFIRANGQARYLTRSNTDSPVASFLQEQLAKDMLLNQPWEYRRSITRIKTHPLSYTPTTLWELIGSAPTLESGVPLVLWGNYTYNNQQVAGKSVITPVATTDYTANTDSTGAGTDKTAEVTLSFYNLGDTAKMTFTYTGAGAAYLTSAKIRGDALYEVSVTDVTYPADTSTVTEPREFVLDLPWQQNVNAARDFVAVMGPFLEVAHPFPTVKIDSRRELQFEIDLFDLVTAEIARVGVSGQSFRVAGIGHQTRGKNCQQVVSTFWLEPYIAGGSYWTWPITNFGVDTVFGW